MAIACADCGAEQRIPPLPERTAAECLRCGRLLDLSERLDLTIGLAWTWAIFLLLFPANLLPLMQASIGNNSRENTLFSGVTAIWGDHWPFLALIFGAFAIILPFVRSGLLLIVLSTIAGKRRPPWLGRIYRYAEAVRLWAMPDVVILAGLVLYMRTSLQMSGHVMWGGWCLIAAAFLSVLTPWALSPHRVWREIMPDQEEPGDGPTISCDVCNLVLPLSAENTPCPRCHRRLHLRKPNAMQRTTALVVTGYVLYFPAYYYPMSYTMQPGGVQQHTIIDGVEELAHAGFWELAVIIFIASIVIPMFKLVGLTWLLVSVHFPSSRYLVLRTRLHRIIHKIGRWSNTDPFIVALMTPLLSFSGFVEVHAGKGALPFALVVIVTMLASRSFDSRLMWDAAEGHL